MNDEHAHLQIRIHGIDGSTQTYIQNDPDVVNGILRELHPTLLFYQDRITIADEDSSMAFLPPLVTRLDLITHRLSVWDFPFVLGAPVELTKAEFMEGLSDLDQRGRADSRSGLPVFLDLEMVNGQHAFLWMQIVAGMPAARLGRVYSIFRERRLIFGLRKCGIGVLNLSNMARFSVYPEPPDTATDAECAPRSIAERRFSPANDQARDRSPNKRLRPVPFPNDHRVVSKPGDLSRTERPPASNERAYEDVA